MLMQTKNTNAFIKVFPNMQFSISVIIQLTRRNKKDDESRSTQYKFVFAITQKSICNFKVKLLHTTVHLHYLEMNQKSCLQQHLIPS